MKGKGYLISSLVCSLLLVAGTVIASTCVDCHTDVSKLKAIAKTLPQKEASSETAGKG